MRKRRFRGSKRLGAELRYLRGDRSLAKIEALSKSPAFSDLVTPVTASTLSQIENGASLPSLDTLATLSLIYQVPIQRFLDMVLEERLVEEVDIPAALDEIKTAFKSALEQGRWAEALALAGEGEERAPTAEEAVHWRANRATCMERVGLRNSAILILMECCHSPDTAPRCRFQMFRTLADAMASAGHLTLAAEAAATALELAPADLDPKWKRGLLHTKASLNVQASQESDPPDEKKVRKAIEFLDEARALLGEDEELDRLNLDLLAAVADGLLGDHEVAAKNLERAALEARQNDHRYVETVARANIGILHRRQEQWEEARLALLAAENIAVDEHYVNETFDIYFELYLVEEEENGGGGEYYLKRCQRFYPLVQARTRNVLKFESIMRQRA